MLLGEGGGLGGGEMGEGAHGVTKNLKDWRICSFLTKKTCVTWVFR